MFAPAVVFDFTALNSLWAAVILVCSIFNTKSTPARPQSPIKQALKRARSIIQDKIFKTLLILIPILYYTLVITGLISLLYTCIYECNLISFQLNVSNHTWMYILALNIIIIITMLIYNIRLQLQQLNTEIMLAIIFIFLCAQIYYCMTNPFTLTVLLECQSAALLLFIATNGSNSIATYLIPTTITLKLIKNSVAVNMLTLQFWISFFGAALLLVSTAWLIFTIGSSHWTDVIHFINLHTALYPTNNALRTVISIFILSLFLKAGVFPFHFWKPELYNNLHLTSVFIYAVPYSAAVIFLIIMLLNIFFSIFPILIKTIILINIVLATYILLAILYFVTEIKAFLAYTSGLHILYVYAATIIDNTLGSCAILYNWAYCLAAFTVFSALLNLKQLSIKYLTDLQLFTQLPTSIFWLSTGVATMAGIPPLLGFWVKFLILCGLWAASEAIIAAHLLCISMAYMYFYVAMYRFSGATNFKVSPARLILVPYVGIANIGISIVIIHLMGMWHVHDLTNYTLLFAFNLHDYL